MMLVSFSLLLCGLAAHSNEKEREEKRSITTMITVRCKTAVGFLAVVVLLLAVLVTTGAVKAEVLGETTNHFRRLSDPSWTDDETADDYYNDEYYTNMDDLLVADDEMRTHENEEKNQGENSDSADLGEDDMITDDDGVGLMDNTATTTTSPAAFGIPIEVDDDGDDNQVEEEEEEGS